MQASDQFGELLGVAALLQDEPLLVRRRPGVQERRGGDRRAAARLREIAQAVAETEEVTVARVALSQRRRKVWQGAELVAAAQQQFGRAERAGADEHVPGRHLALDSLTAGAGVAVLAQADLVPVARSGNVNGFREGADSRTVLLGERQIVQVQGVLGALVAADIALAGERAGALGDPKLVRPVVLEPHRQVGVEEAVGMPQQTGRIGHQPRLGWQLAGSWISRHRPDVEHVRDQVVIRLQQRAAVRLGPGLGKDLLGRAHGHVGVDQRPAAVPRSPHRQDVVERLRVVQAVVAQPQPAIVEAVEVAGETPRRPPPAPFDDRDVHSRLREPAHRHRAAEAAADDQGFELVAAQVLPSRQSPCRAATGGCRRIARRGHRGPPSRGAGRRATTRRSTIRGAAFLGGWVGILPAIATRSIQGSRRSAGLGCSHNSTTTPPLPARTRTWERTKAGANTGGTPSRAGTGWSCRSQQPALTITVRVPSGRVSVEIAGAWVCPETNTAMPGGGTAPAIGGGRPCSRSWRIAASSRYRSNPGASHGNRFAKLVTARSAVGRLTRNTTTVANTSTAKPYTASKRTDRKTRNPPVACPNATSSPW